VAVQTNREHRYSRGNHRETRSRSEEIERPSVGTFGGRIKGHQGLRWALGLNAFVFGPQLTVQARIDLKHL
jgi:hypothetical protein